MKKITGKYVLKGVYEFGKYRVEIILNHEVFPLGEKEDVYEAWLTEVRGGCKMFLYGESAKNITYRKFKELIEWSLTEEDYIEDYEADMDALEAFHEKVIEAMKGA